MRVNKLTEYETDGEKFLYRVLSVEREGKSKQTSVAFSSSYYNNVVIGEVAFSSVRSSKVAWQRSNFHSFFFSSLASRLLQFTGGNHLISEHELFCTYKNSALGAQQLSPTAFASTLCWSEWCIIQTEASLSVYVNIQSVYLILLMDQLGRYFFLHYVSFSIRVRSIIFSHCFLNFNSWSFFQLYFTGPWLIFSSLGHIYWLGKGRRQRIFFRPVIENKAIF